MPAASYSASPEHGRMLIALMANRVNRAMPHPLIQRHHWLPIEKGHSRKNVDTKAGSRFAPFYLAELLEDYIPDRVLRLSDLGSFSLKR